MSEITEHSEFDRIEVVTNFKIVQARKVVYFKRGEEKIPNTERYVRYSISPGQDYSEFPEEIQAICQLFHTPELIKAYIEYCNSI